MEHPPRNDAQHAFLSILESLDPASTTEVVVQEALHGNLNLAALHNAGFKRVETVRFLTPGELTQVINVPDSVTTLEISQQRLTELTHLPTNLVEMNASHNDLVRWSGKDLPKLKRLNLSNNRLESLSDLPASLLELECNNNLLKRLDLSPTIVLARLHCRNNPLLTLERLPPTASADLEYDSTSLLDLSFQGDEEASVGKDIVIRKRNFNLRECLQRYFALKAGYEDGLRQQRRESKEMAMRQGMPLKEAIQHAKKTVHPRCIQCGDAAGTIFSHEKQHYRARCGKGKDECDLQMDIFLGDHDSLSTLVEEFRDHMEDSKQAIIEQKMQTLFGYLDKKHSAELFQQNMDLYQEVSENCKSFTAKYKHVYDNPERKVEERKLLEHALELVADEARLLREYRATGNRQVLRQAISNHIDLVVPARRAWQRHVYPHMWVEIHAEDQPDVLMQQHHAVQDDDVVYGEAARVIHFNV
jgi:hypothetical protein